MSPCKVKRGIFSPRECGGPAVEQCSTCQLPLCLEHAHYGRDQVLCPQCQMHDQDDGDTGDDDGDWESPGWSQRWRSDNESMTSGALIGASTSRHHDYDDLDRSGFSTRADSLVSDDDGDGPAGFSDS